MLAQRGDHGVVLQVEKPCEVARADADSPLRPALHGLTVAWYRLQRVSQELGGKSANIVLDDADLERAVRQGVMTCFTNSGQSCNAPTRMLVPASKHAEALEIAKATAEKVVAGEPDAEGTTIGPVSNKVQFDKIRGLIQAGIDEGAELVCGGPDMPEGVDKGYYIRPTVFGNVTNDMRIAREEIFGPVLSILPYETEEDAVEEDFEDVEVDEVIDQSNDFEEEILSDEEEIEGDEFGEEESDEEGDQDLEDKVDDLEDELEDLKAEFEKMMGDKEDGDDAEDHSDDAEDNGDDKHPTGRPR